MDWTLCLVHPPLLFLLLFILEHIFYGRGQSASQKGPTPGSVPQSLGEGWHMFLGEPLSYFRSSSLPPSTYWEWHQIASCNLASYQCYQAGTPIVFKPVSARVTETCKHTVSTLWIFFLLISNVHILIPVKLAELLNTLVGTASGWKGRMFVNGWDKTARRVFHRRGNSKLIPGSAAWQCLWFPSLLLTKSNRLLNVTIYALSELCYL